MRCLALDADGVAARAAAEASARLADVPGDFQAGLVVADDLMGGWTNRYDYEFTLRFGPRPLPGRLGPKADAGDGFWVTGVLWSSEAPTERAVREAILTAAYRVAYGHRHGPARTLRDMLAQEGHVMAMAGCAGPVLDEETSPTRARCWPPSSTRTTSGPPSSACSGTRRAARWASRRAA